MLFDMIAFDADDTLWHSESYYQDAQQQFAAFLAPYQSDQQAVLSALHQVEIANLPSFGYGVKGFVFSMIETAIQLSNGQITGKEIQTLIDLARTMLQHDVNLLDGARQAVEELSQTYPLMLITKGDLIDQERKFHLSGLAPFFQSIEVISEKNSGVYRSLLARRQVDPTRFLMVGNSLKSDVFPVIELGGYGVHIPYAVTWAHETVSAAPPAPERFFELQNLGQLPGLIRELKGA